MEASAQPPAVPQIIAHRGVRRQAVRENTIAAFEVALSAGAQMIETDVRRSGDGQLAILHDQALDGATLSDCSLDEFERRTGFRPPLLTEVLAWANGRIALDIELKEDGYAQEVVPLLREFAAAGNGLITTSFLDQLLNSLAKIAPELELGLLVEDSAGDAVKRATQAGARIVLPEMKLVDDALISHVTEAGLKLIVWDFMAADHSWLLADPRLTAVITDDVPGALSALRARATDVAVREAHH
ncbi:MAG: glycerophosphodiester phosphodiesterase [Solirubrobacteraceae bacterium]